MGDENEQEEFVLDACSLGSKTIMTFVGIDSMDAAETLIGKSLFLPRSAFADAEDDDVITSYSIHYTKLYEANIVNVLGKIPFSIKVWPIAVKVHIGINSDAADNDYIKRHLHISLKALCLKAL